MKRNLIVSKLCLFLLLTIMAASAIAKDEIPAAAPMTTDLAGSSGSIALTSVFRVNTGTGFLHKSGAIITAAHVVGNLAPNSILVIGNQGHPFVVDKLEKDPDLDLALLFLKTPIKAPTLALSNSKEIKVGLQVSTWGFPAGYNGLSPLLSTGYVSGRDQLKSQSGKLVPRLVVNAAFNLGNSGGPLVEIEKNTVVGVVVSKLAPLPNYIETYLNALKVAKYGLMFTKTNPDGSKEEISEAQVIEVVLQYLRSQTQLVIGYSVLIEDLNGFLKKNGIEP